MQSDRRFWLKSPDPELAPFSNFRLFSNSGFSDIWKHAIPDFTWQYTTCRSEFRTTVQRSRNVTGRTLASELVWVPSSFFPLSPSSLSALTTAGSGNCFGCTVCFGLDILMSFFSNVPVSGVRPNSSAPEEFQALPRFRSVAVARTHPVADASAERTVWSGLSQFHGLCLCASPVVSQRSTSGMPTLLSTWTLQQILTKDSCHR